MDINSHTEWQTVQIQISWLLMKPTDLDLHCLQKQGISGFSRTRVKYTFKAKAEYVRLSISVFRYYYNIFQLFLQQRKLELSVASSTSPCPHCQFLMSPTSLLTVIEVIPVHPRWILPLEAHWDIASVPQIFMQLVLAHQMMARQQQFHLLR